jgi:hypothetical protein
VSRTIVARQKLRSDKSPVSSLDRMLVFVAMCVLPNCAGAKGTQIAQDAVSEGSHFNRVDE